MVFNLLKYLIVLSMNYSLKQKNQKHSILFAIRHLLLISLDMMYRTQKECILEALYRLDSHIFKQ